MRKNVNSVDKLEVLPDSSHNRTPSSGSNNDAQNSTNSRTNSTTSLPQNQFNQSNQSNQPNQSNQLNHNRNLSSGSNAPTGNSIEDANASKIRQMKDVIDVVADVASRIENDSSFLDKIKSGLEKLSSKNSFGDLELECQSMFEQIIGMDSKTAKVFSAIHQNIIFAGIFQLKSKLPLDVMTRDVRSREGWLISVQFLSNVTIITHKRREQSLATAKAEETFYFEWHLIMYFDKNMNNLESATLKITDLVFSPEASISFRMNIQRQLSAGSLIVT